METNVGDAVLLLEDQPLIAIDVEELLQEAGFSNVSTYSSCAAAKEWLQTNKPTLAVIETTLRDGPCDEIAHLLAHQGIRFVVHSAETDKAGRYQGLSARFSWVEKPCDPTDFLNVVKACCASR
ncbi:MAG: response regulator [Pseudorhizobium sp.]